MLRAQQAIEHLFNHNRVELDQFGKSLDDLVLENPWVIHISNWLNTMCCQGDMALKPSGTFSRPLMTGIRKRTSGTRLWYRSRTLSTNSGDGGTGGKKTFYF